MKSILNWLQEYQFWIILASIFVLVWSSIIFDIIKKNDTPDPKIGEHWIDTYEKDNPFEKNTYYLIDEVKNGWVAYYWVHEGHVGWTRYSRSIKEFKSSKEKTNAN